MRFIPIIWALCFAMPVAGQPFFPRTDDQIFHAGLQLGANFCQVDGDGFSGYHKVGFAGGALVYIRLHPNPDVTQMHASLGISYTQKGSREGNIRDYRLTLNYAEIPLLIHLFGRKGFHVSGGISYARLISSKEEVSDPIPQVLNADQYPFKKQDWSGILGIGYWIHGQWCITGQYQYTIGSMRDPANIPTGYGFTGERNNAMSLRLLYIIPSGSVR